MQLKDMITESFNKEYAYRVKIAYDCTNEHLDMIEQAMAKYNVVSAAPWKRQPIQENPQEFVRLKGASFTSEVNSTDVVIKYPANPRILEVWLSVNLGLDHDRVLVYEIKEPRATESEVVANRVANDKDRTVTEDDAVLAQEDQAHDRYEEYQVDQDSLYGEEYNAKFMAELARIKKEKGSDYFRNYPTKDDLMGDGLWEMWGELHNGVNMGRGNEKTKEVDVISQASRRN